jgi:hypothetical protein
MNRTLRRPMFRMGGSTGEGITSGLDMPKTNASRQGYEPGGNVMPESEMDLSRFKNNDDMGSRYNRAMDFIKSKQSPRSNNLNDFLISMGLDLVSRPTSGNIFADVATSSKEPFAQMQAAKASRASDQDKLSQALIGDIMEQMSDEEIARIEAKAEQGKGGKEFEYKGKYEDYKKLLDQQRNLEAQKRQLEEQNKIALETMEPDETGLTEQIRIINQQIEDNAKLQNLFQDKEEDAVRAAILKGISNGIFTFDDLIVYDETGVPPREDNADGGRIGYQQGNMVQPNAMPAAMPMDQGPTQDSTVQDLSFEELRSRLPESITNDVVTLIANSQQALVEFANIQTQQDVKEFNRKYEVNLVLPQEA